MLLAPSLLEKVAQLGEIAVSRVGLQCRVTILAPESEPVCQHDSAWTQALAEMVTKAVAVEPWDSFVESKSLTSSWRRPWVFERAMTEGGRDCTHRDGKTTVWLAVDNSPGGYWVGPSRPAGFAAGTWRAWKAWEDLQTKPSNH